MHLEKLQNIRSLIDEGRVEDALSELELCEIAGDMALSDILYLRGNAWRKLGHFQNALNSYNLAIAHNPASVATQARQALVDILEYYNKDLYNP